MSALWAVWFLVCGLVAWGCLRAARDYRDDAPVPGPVWDADRQQWTHEQPTDPDTRPGIRDDWAALCEEWLALPDYDPNHRTTGGNQ